MSAYAQLKKILPLAVFLFLDIAPAWPDNCDPPSEGTAATVSVHCGAAPSATFDSEGNLWVAFVQDSHVYVTRSADLGQSFSTPAQVNPVPENVEFNGENRPKIVISPEGNLLLSWTLKTSPRFTGEIRFTRSLDGGHRFEPPRTINDDGLLAGHRFDSLLQTLSGHVYITWIDKRDQAMAGGHAQETAGGQVAGPAHAGAGAHMHADPNAEAAIYYAVSSDGGVTFSRNYRVAPHSCECCRIAIAPHGENEAAIFWRHVFGDNIRDHAVAILTPDGAAGQQRATEDDWHIEACPHHGPAMATAPAGGQYHLTWFSNGDRLRGIQYGLFDNRTGELTQLRQVDGGAGAGHPSVATLGERVYLVWKTFNGRQTLLQLLRSNDGGLHWSAPRTLLRTGGASDHPLLVRGNGVVILSWLTEEQGYIVRELTHEK